MKSNRFSGLLSALATSLILAACGGGGGDSTSRLANIDPSIEANSLSKTNETLSDIQSLVVDPLLRLNTINNIFNDQTIDFVYTTCTQNNEPIANAFYVETQNIAVLCDLLTDQAQQIFLAAGFPQDVAEVAALRAMNFVAFHEMGHALVLENEHALGGNAESIADAIAVVLAQSSGQEGSTYAAALLFELMSQLVTQSTFLDEHPANQDRAGDISCWWLGANPEQANRFESVQRLAENFAAIGRDCVGEFSDQNAFVQALAPDLVNLRAPAAANELTEQEIALQTETLNAIMNSLNENLSFE